MVSVHAGDAIASDTVRASQRYSIQWMDRCGANIQLCAVIETICLRNKKIFTLLNILSLEKIYLLLGKYNQNQLSTMKTNADEGGKRFLPHRSHLFEICMKIKVSVVQHCKIQIRNVKMIYTIMHFLEVAYLKKSDRKV